MTNAADADVVYIRQQEADADKADKEVINSVERARASRLRSGQRLIEVRQRMLSELASGNEGFPDAKRLASFARWLESIPMAQATASARMRDAGFTEEQREDHKAKERERKNAANAKKRTFTPIGWIAAMERYSGLHMQWGGSQRRTIEEHFGIDLRGHDFTSEAEARDFATRAAVLFVKKEEATKDRDDLSKTAQERYDSALSKAIEKHKQELNDKFWKEVDAKVKERIPKDLEEARQTVRAYTLKLKGVASQMSVDDFRFLQRILHPDRKPSDEERARGFDIVSKLGDYVKAANR